jgi:hypothetical protein
VRTPFQWEGHMAPRAASRVPRSSPGSLPIRQVPSKQDSALDLRVDEFGLLAPGGSEWTDPTQRASDISIDGRHPRGVRGRRKGVCL